MKLSQRLYNVPYRANTMGVADTRQQNLMLKNGRSMYGPNPV